jgi:3',5'-cyclic AMP phosphodiesterase CpdA
MKIAHFGDLHFAAADLKSSASGPGSLHSFTWALCDAFARGVDHIVISGDLLEGGYPAGYRKVRHQLERAGVFDPRRLSIVPGNHDLFYYPAVLCGKPRRTFLHHMGVTLRQAGQSSLLRLSTRSKRHKAFWETFDELVPAACRVFDQAQLPFIKPLGGDVVLVGMDTTAPRVSKLPGRCQLQSVAGHTRVEDWLAVASALQAHWPNQRRVVLMHHYPFRTRPTGFRKRDYLRLWQCLRRIRAEAVLCGHLHASNGTSVRRGRVAIFCQGTSGGVHRTTPTYSLHDFSLPGQPRTEVYTASTASPRWLGRRTRRRRFRNLPA